MKTWFASGNQGSYGAWESLVIFHAGNVWKKSFLVC